MALKIQLRDDYDAVRLRDLARCSSDPRQVRRLLSLAAVYDGLSREAAAAVGGMDRQTLRDWVHRFNKDGPEGLANRKGAGRPRLLTEDRMQTLAAIVESGPDPATDGVVRWRRVDLQRVIEARFDVSVSVRSISRLLGELSFSHISTRPQHPKQDQQVIEAFKNFPLTLAAHIAGLPKSTQAKSTQVEIWFQDEARLGQKNARTRIWAKKGTRPRQIRVLPADQRYENAYLFGAICPVNHKVVERIYGEERLALRRRPRKRFAKNRVREGAWCPIRANQRWSLDFTEDGLANGVKFRTCNLKDDCTRERPRPPCDQTAAPTDRTSRPAGILKNAPTNRLAGRTSTKAPQAEG